MAKKVQRKKATVSFSRIRSLLKNAEIQRRLWVSFSFFAKFMLLALPLHFLLWANLDTTWLQEITAAHTYAILKFLPLDMNLSGIRLVTENFIFVFTRDCTAWKTMLAFVALVVAAPFVQLSKRLRILAIGLPAIYLLNIARTTTTIMTGLYSPSTLDVVHTFLWREGMILVVFAMWLVWYRKNRSEIPESLPGLQMVSRFIRGK